MRAGKSLPGVKVELENEIPLGVGLGSSAAAIVAGTLLGAELCGVELGSSDLLRMALELESHPDNLAAAIHGGMVIAAIGDSGEAPGGADCSIGGTGFYCGDTRCASADCQGPGRVASDLFAAGRGGKSAAYGAADCAILSGQGLLRNYFATGCTSPIAARWCRESPNAWSIAMRVWRVFS